MSRLVAFGCSYTFGQDLPGADYENNVPSNHAWPSVLARHLRLKSVNQAVPGSSNLEILWKILQFKFDSSDTCFIMWSHFSRAMMFCEDGIQRLDFGSLGVYEKAWFRVHPKYDQIINNWIYIHHATMYLNTLGIKPYHLLSGGSAPDPTCTIQVPLILNSKFIFVDRAADNHHPGIHSNSLLANKIFDEISSIE